MLTSQTKDREEVVRVPAVSSWSSSSCMLRSLTTKRVYTRRRERLQRTRKGGRKESTQGRAWDEGKRDAVGSPGAGATSSCLYFLLFHRLSCPAHPTPFLIKLLPKGKKIMELATPMTREWEGWARRKSQSYCQLPIRGECFPGKS